MRNKKRFIAAIACVMVIGLTACGNRDDNATNNIQQVEPIPFTENIEWDNGDIEKQDEIETQQKTETQNVIDAQEVQEQVAPESDEKLEEKLAAYREARENAKPTSLGNGVTMGGSVSEEEYGISYDASILETFDSREIAEAYGAANSYVEDTLGISVETRNTTYHCVDPRIWAIYSAEDKGVANGYDPENIYVVEYCDNGTWQYLILVREEKGSAWKVMHHGSSYME
ncbi:MAG: hypothetical protein HDR01_03910 [Lachnospiraceae bacterium]|nr:hypothetical protein [Lachnospiraceae bacterium]